MNDTIEKKVHTIREGSCSRTAEELTQVFFADAQFILQSKKLEARELGEDDIREVEGLLSDAGFTTFWDDGYVIYKDLTEDEARYLDGFYL